MRGTAQVWFVALAASAVHCGDAGEFVCEANTQCVSGETQGVCEVSGYCSFADSMCPSGQRYGSQAPAHLAKTCVPSSVAEGGTGSTSSKPTEAESGEAGTTFGLDDTANDDAAEVTGPMTRGGMTSPATTTSDDGSGTTTRLETGSGSGSTTEGLPCPPFVDDFEDGVIDPIWVQAFPEELAEDDGELFMSITPGDITDASGVQIFDVDLRQAQTSVELGVLPQSPFSQTVFVILSPNGEHLMFVVSPTQLLLRVGDGVTQAQQPVTLDLDPSAHRWLRFVVDEPGAAFETSPDGESWNTLHELQYDWSFEDGRVDILATNWSVLPSAETVSVRSFELCP